MFRGVAAYVGLVALGPGESCLVTDARDSGNATCRRGRVSSENWWQAVEEILGHASLHPPAGSAPLATQFEVRASMTAAEAYLVREHLRDDLPAGGPKLVTAGLVDPFHCRWGQKRCRYLGVDYGHPWIDPVTASQFRRRLAIAARPKLLVAGLCKQLEAWFDERGECAGAVSTFTILHPADSRKLLERLCRWLNSTEANDRLRRELGGAALAGGYVTVTRQALRDLLLPVNLWSPEERGV